jgi:hypothetical protein
MSVDCEQRSNVKTDQDKYSEKDSGRNIYLWSLRNNPLHLDRCAIVV